MIVRDKAKLASAKSRFTDTGINVTLEAEKHLGAWLGDKSSVHNHLITKVGERVGAISLLSEIAQSQPHAAFSAFINGVISQ